MELRVLKYFLVTAQEKNITKAAEILHITQPTLSRQLMELEDELNTTLFIRGKREITLTDDGLFLKERAEEIVELSEKTKRDFINQKENLTGVISIGCVEAVSTEKVIDVIEKFSKKYPNVQFDFYNGYGDDIKQRIDKGLIDIGFVLEPIEISKYEFIRVSQKEKWGMAVNIQSPLAQKDFISLEEIFSYPLILPKRGAIQNEIVNWFNSHSLEPKIFATYNILSNAVILVEKNLGYAVCMEGAFSLKNNDKVKFIPFEPEKIIRGIFIWKKNQMPSLSVSLFIDEVKMLLKHDNK